ncbi:MAG: ATP synthase F1 subunit delta [Turicibacter sp.]|nr:ATP synthase F1 subunit delta [Turicibacter sp.]
MLDKTTSTYGKALFDLALEANALEQVDTQLETFSQALESTPDAKDILIHSQLPKETKKGIFMAALADMEDSLLYNFIMVLVDKDRAEYLDGIIAAFRHFTLEHFGIAEGTVASAVALSDLQLSQLAATLSKKLDKTVKLNPVVDPGLIGGYRVNIGGNVFDNSLKFQLDQLKQNLLTVELS